MEKLEFVLIVSLVVFLCAVGVILATLLHFERRKRIRFRNHSSPSMMREFGGETFPPQSSGRSSQVPLTSRAEAVRFESPMGRSAFEVTIPSKKYMEAQAWQKLELSNQSRQWLSPFLDGASEALKLPLLAHLATTQTFRIVFDGAGELMRSKSGAGFRSILIDKNSHRVVSHGLLLQAGQGAATGLLLWECAAVIVGRKYLADIDRKLGRIDAGISDIRAFLENERVGKLQADCKLLGDTADALRRDPSFLFCNTALQHSIEAVEQNASAVVRACLLDLQSIRQALNHNISLKAVSDADLSPLSQAVSKAVHTLHAASFALSRRVCCAAFLGSYMEDEHLRTARLSDVVTLWKQLNEESESIQTVTKEKINSMSEWLSFETTLEAKKQKALSEAQHFFRLAAQSLKASKDEVDSASAERSLLRTAAAPIELALTVDRGGRILTALVAGQSA
jgi:hypothetical protein